MTTVNISDGLANYGQRNNEVNPFSSCNTTSLTMGTSYIKKLWQLFTNSPSYLKYKQYSQPEDRLQRAMLDWGLEPTNHYDLMKGYNKFIGQEVDQFSTTVKFKDLVDDLLSGKPWVGSGTFPGHPTLHLNSKTKVPEPLGHIVTVVGIVYESDPLEPSEVIIDDPYGNTMQDWIGSGNDVHIPWPLFVKWMKPVGDASTFWAHRFRIPE